MSADSRFALAIIPCKGIHDEVELSAEPARIYEALLDSKRFKELSGGRAATIDRPVGGTFTIFDGHISGRNLELAPGRRIVQAWRVGDWPEGVHSIARFELQPSKNGTRVAFDHSGVPSDQAEHLERGWQENYGGPLRKYLALAG